jgi:hypothetical protein
MKEKKKTLEEISASIKRYYDTLTDEERAEDLAWGEFAAMQFRESESSDEWLSALPRIASTVKPRSKARSSKT